MTSHTCTVVLGITSIVVGPHKVVRLSNNVALMTTVPAYKMFNWMVCMELYHRGELLN